ncbi:MAG: hypothetical protein AAGA61_05975 [Pseudomonadota bacterium]
MKCITTLICLITLTGCAAYVPIEDLKAQALRSGDWSEVEKRERIIAKREARYGASCPKGTLSVCETIVGGNDCQCVGRNSADRLLTRRW